MLVKFYFMKNKKNNKQKKNIQKFINFTKY